MMAGKGEWEGRCSNTVLPGLGVTKVSELPGDQVRSAEGKCLLVEGVSAVRGHGMNEPHQAGIEEVPHEVSQRMCYPHSFGMVQR